MRALFATVFCVGCMDYVLTGEEDEAPAEDPVFGFESADGGSTGAGSSGGSGGAEGSGGSAGSSGSGSADSSGASGGGGGSSSGGGSGSSSGGGSSSSGSSGGSAGDGGSEGTGGTEPDPEPGETRSNPRTPSAGELVINEIMIDPDAVSDASGEWVELWNLSDDWLDVEGYRLADDSADDYTFDEVSNGSLVVGPGDYLVICAEPSRSDNGGIDCDGEFFYQTWGGGFALSNTEDEVVLVTPGGSEVDRFEYGSGFSMTGSSLGVDPWDATVTDNDDPDSWCDQWDRLSSGDWGTPGYENDYCW